MENLEYLPQEMKDAQLKLNTAMRRNTRARKQLQLWQKEVDLAERDFRATEAWYGTVTCRWSPTTNTMDPPGPAGLEEIQ